jgi:hypothetical protein
VKSFQAISFASRFVTVGAATYLLLAFVAAAQAEHVASPKMLPRDTLLYAHVSSVPDLIAAFNETNFGRMINDPQIKPFMQGALETANNMLTQVKERTGMSIEELAKLPQGEISFALLPRDPNGTKTEGLDMAIIVDCGDSIIAARKVSDKVRGGFEDAGYRVRQEAIDGFAVSLYEYGNGNSPAFVLFERDNTMAVCSGMDVAKFLLARWTNGGDDCLAENGDFVAAMDRCRGVKDETPQVTFFADPISMARELSRGNPGAQIALAMLPALGLDGFLGVGGSLVLATEDFDSIFQIHVLLQSPRSGVLDLVAMDAGDDTPPPWMPADVASYLSVHWNFEDFFAKGTKLGDNFMGEGAMANRVNDRAIRTLGVDFQHDLMPYLTGRLLHLTWFERPVRLGVGANTMVAAQLTDAKAFAPTFDKILARFGNTIEKKTYSGVAYYQTAGQYGPDDIRPRPCFALLDDWVLVADRPSIMEHILVRRDGGSDRLASDLEYKLVASKIGRQPGGKTPGLLSFSRPEESWKYMYDLAKSDTTRDTLRNMGQNMAPLKALNQGLEKNPLPPWSAISRYIAPGGSMAVNDDSGIHYMQFSLKRK